jgi:hypothetical protein
LQKVDQMIEELNSIKKIFNWELDSSPLFVGVDRLVGFDRTDNR